MKAWLLAPLALGLGMAQLAVPLEQAGSRAGTDFGPALEGKSVIIQGQISVAPIWILDTYYLPIQDVQGYGMMLTGTSQPTVVLSPGDWVEVRGTVLKRGGSPVVQPDEIKKIGSGPPPAPKVLSV